MGRTVEEINTGYLAQNILRQGKNMLEPELAIPENITNIIKKERTLKLVTNNGSLIKSKARVQHHGEVFTPNWMVKKMLSEPSIQEKIHDLHATFLEPSAGEGAFLTEILNQKLNYVTSISNKSSWQTNAVWALMSIYGIELLPDNVKRARNFMFQVAQLHYEDFFKKKLSTRTNFYKTTKFVINANIVQGNALTYKTNEDTLIRFSDWQVIDKKNVKREDFTYKSMFDDSDDNEGTSQQLNLFAVDEDKPKIVKYAICPVLKVYKEEKDE